jgi:hypothetical protein
MAMMHRALGVMFAAVLLVAAATVAQGCGDGPTTVGACPRTPDEGPGYYDPVCVELRAQEDAGTKDAGDASVDGMPGAGPLSCPGLCVPEAPPGWYLEGQKPIPDLVWSGAALELPAFCAEGLTSRGELFTGLVAPPADCDACGCEEPKGTCPGLPAQIEIHAGKCGDPGAAQLPFDGPAGWDGTCTAANALPAGAQCPSGSGTPCAQSVTVSALPAPVEEPCNVTETEKPKFTASHWWETAARTCIGAEIPGAKCDGSFRCVHNLALPYRQCISRSGEHACPAGYDTGERFVMYPKDGIDDGRGCTDCTCGAPVGGACVATLSVYADGACATPVVKGVPIGSLGPQCINLMVPGQAMGSKAITDRAYLPGTCMASGGDPFGTAHPNDAEAVTFCCLPAFAPSE